MWAAAVGIVSGLAATGVDQVVKQMSAKDEIDYKKGYYNVLEENTLLLKELEAQETVRVPGTEEVE